MATTETPRAIANDFINGRKPRKRLKSIIVRENELQSYGPHFPLLRRGDDGTFLLNAEKVSQTTTRHTRGCIQALDDNGYGIIGFGAIRLYGGYVHSVHIYGKKD